MNVKWTSPGVEFVNEASGHYITTLIWRDERDEQGWYRAEDQRLPRCLADGETAEEARGNLESTRIDYIAAMIANGLPVPEWWKPND